MPLLLASRRQLLWKRRSHGCNNPRVTEKAVPNSRPLCANASDARARLRAADYALMEGCNNDRFEIWLDRHGCPHIINYVGRDKTQFLKKDVDELVPMN